MSEQGPTYDDMDTDAPSDPLEPSPEYSRLEFDNIEGRTLDIVDGLHKAMRLDCSVAVIDSIDSPWQYQETLEQEFMDTDVYDYDEDLLDVDMEAMVGQAEESAVSREAIVPAEKIARDALSSVLIESIEELDRLYGLTFILLDPRPDFDDDHPDMGIAVAV
jgi:hypothetical protein